MSGLTVKVEGDVELIKELKRLGVDVDRVMAEALKKGAEVIQRAANPNAPSPHVEIGEVTKRGRGAEVRVGPDDAHWYHKFMETGVSAHRIGAAGQVLTLYGEDFISGSTEHHGFPARPFLRPALDENEGRAQGAMGDRLKDAILKGRGG